MDVKKQSIAMEELKKQVEALGLTEKQKTKFLMEEWKRLCEEKRLETEREEKRLKAEREEKRLEAEWEEKRLEAEREEKRLEAERERKKKCLEVEREREHELEMRWIDAEEKKAAMDLKRARFEFESKKR